MPKNNLEPIEFSPGEFAKLDFDEFIEKIHEKLDGYRKTHSSWYEGVRKRNADWANKSRRIQAILAALAVLFTSVGSVIRFTDIGGAAQYDKYVLALALLFYAWMAAVSAYEQIANRTPTYFRALGIILAIRDLWTVYEFEALKQLTAAKADPKGEPDARKTIEGLAEAFCKDLNAAAAAELKDWKTEAIASLTALKDVVKTGREDVAKQKTEQEQAAKASQQGYVNLKLAGTFAGEPSCTVANGQPKALGPGREFVVGPLDPGPASISVTAPNGQTTVGASRVVTVKPGEAIAETFTLV